MSAERIVLLTHVCDQADILSTNIEWYLNLGVDFILIQDVGSTDGTQDILDRFASNYPLSWFSLKESDLRKHPTGSSGDSMATLARDEYEAKWLIMCDADEFLCLPNEDLHGALDRAEYNQITSISVQCFNMTGPPPAAGSNAVEVLTLRIDRPQIETAEQQLSGDIPVPYIFIRHPPKTIVSASAFAAYGPGSHAANVSIGKVGEIPGARFNHYPIRDFSKLEKKICNAAAFFTENEHLEGWFGWHWRRWIRLKEAARLREDYENQFVSPARAEQLIRDGICSVDNTVAGWISQRSTLARPTWGQKILG